MVRIFYPIRLDAICDFNHRPICRCAESGSLVPTSKVNVIPSDISTKAEGGHNRVW